MTEMQIQLQNALTTTFLANLAFLSEYDNKLYQRVDELSRMIETGSYKEKYALEFVMDDGEFDIYDIVNDKYLYNRTPKKINEELVRNVEFDEKYSIFNVETYFAFKNKFDLEQDNRFEFETLDDLKILTSNDAFEYSNALGNFLEDKKKKLVKVNKFIFVGTLLGRHIPRIAKKLNAKLYLVLERNLEIFRLSLFTVDYTVLASSGVIFSIMDTIKNEEESISLFFNISKLDNYMLKFSTTNINIREYVDNILSTLYFISPTGFDYNRYLYTHINRTTKILDSKYRTLLFNKINENCEYFRNIPILYIAAGPSLDESINWIKENQNKFFIVTIGSAYKKLLSNGVHIDIIATLDEQSHILNDKQFDDDSVNKISEDTIILASTITNEKILKKFKQENLFLYEVLNPLHKNNVPFEGISIGEVALEIILKMNASEVYILGLDLSLNQETGETHSKESSSNNSKLDLTQKQDRNIFDSRKSLIKVKGNIKERVITTPVFYTSIKYAESKIFFKNEDTKIYNLSSNGAFFQGTIPINKELVETQKYEDLLNIKEDFRKFFIENSRQNLSGESQNKLKKEIIFIEKEIKIILQDITSIEFSSFEKFFEKILSIPEKINEKRFFIFHSIVVNYFEVMVPYLSYHFNESKIKNESKKVKKVKDVFIKQIEIIASDYVQCLKRVVK